MDEKYYYTEEEEFQLKSDSPKGGTKDNSVHLRKLCSFNPFFIIVLFQSKINGLRKMYGQLHIYCKQNRRPPGKLLEES